MCLFTGITFKCHFSPGLPNGSPKIKTLVVPKLWRLISFSNQVFFENARAISYSLQKDLSNGVKHASIKLHLSLAFKAFMVRS
jgi:hypothetical protein